MGMAYEFTRSIVKGATASPQRPLKFHLTQNAPKISSAPTGGLCRPRWEPVHYISASESVSRRPLCEPRGNLRGAANKIFKN